MVTVTALEDGVKVDVSPRQCLGLLNRARLVWVWVAPFCPVRVTKQAARQLVRNLRGQGYRGLAVLQVGGSLSIEELIPASE